MDDERYYTPAEVAEQFRVSRQSVYNWITEGRLQAVRLGDVLRIPSKALAAFVQPVRPGEALSEGESGTAEPPTNKRSPALALG